MFGLVIGLIIVWLLKWCPLSLNSISPLFTPDRTQRQEREVMLKLKEVVDKQRDELRAKVQEISGMSKEVEAVRVQTTHRHTPF